MSEIDGPNLEQLLDLCTPWCIHVAVTLKIAELIEAGNGRIDQLAQQAKCDPEVLQSMLRHLVYKGVFVETERGTFGLNEVARQLMDPALRIGLDLDGLGHRFAHVWGTMLEYVRSGVPAYEERFGSPFWEDLNAHPDLSAQFDALIGPTGHGTPDPHFEISGGWNNIRTVADVGGGTGAMLAEILRLHPHVNGLLIDFPATVERAKEVFKSADIVDRVETSGQSFFDPLPRGADVYLLRGVINDWPDRESKEILRRCAEAARPNGRVVVLKSVGPDESRGRLMIEMILVGGKHRTLTDFRKLAVTAGLNVISAEQQNKYFVVECKPVN